MGGGVIVMWWRKQRQRIQDLRTRHALELEHESLARHLKYLTKFANDIILLIDKDDRIVDFNDRALEAYGYPAGEFRNMSMSRLRADMPATQFSEQLDKLDSTGTLRFECNHVRRNGEVFPVEYSMRTVDISGEEYRQALIRDISERKKAEKRLQRLNRSLKLLVECNSALVHITGEKTLLAEICKLIVKTGGYRLAWVGFAGNDPDKLVHPAERYGHDEGYLDQAIISWADTEHGRGPTGTAIRTGATQVNQDVLTNAAMGPWREAALARNFLSSIALPLKCEGSIIGALTLYAGQRHAFSADEVTLLEELAGNLTYGIMALRMADERALAESHFENERTRLRTLVQTIPDLVWLKDTEGVYLSANQRFEQLFCAQEADIIGKTDYDFVDRELADFFRMHDRRAMEADQPSVNEEWLTFAATGYRGLFETIKTPMRDLQGKVIGVLGVSRDITERINAEASIRELNADLDATLKAIPDLLFELDQNGTYINIWARNPALLATQKENLLGRTVNEMLPREAAETVMAALGDAEAQGYSHGQVFRLDLPQGEHWFELSTSVKSTHGVPGKRYIMLSRDITEQKLAARTLASSYAQLQRLTLHMESVRADERAKIALNLHDEMGATLAAMKMRIAWLASRLPASAQQLTNEATQISELVSDSIHIMHQVVTQLRPHHMEDVELIEAIRHYVQKFRRHTNIECILNLDEVNFALDTDRSLTVFRILQESLNNVAMHAQASRVNITITKRDGSLLMVIKDNGKGFDTSLRKERSFGLLGIRERALMVGGKARVMSTPGKGTRVTVNIPCSAPHQNKMEVLDA
jgi:PAS domain S-box-containing protein